LDGETSRVTVGLADVLARFTFPDEQQASLERLNDVAPTPGAFVVPEPDAARELLGLLQVAPDAIDDAIEGLPSPEATPEAWWVLERLYHELAALDGRGGPLWWPYPEPADDATARFFQLYVFLAALPRARQLHVERGIPDDVSWATLQDVWLSIEWYRKRNGRPGFNSAFWMSQHFRGGIFLLGRLQFNFSQVVFDPPPGAAFAKDDPCLGVHIPALGPLTPEACNASFARAREFFPKHFPERSFRVATCGSWLLDPQLIEYLAEDSNIVRFQRMFTPAPDWSEPGDDDVIRFVFGYLPSSIDDLPQTTTMERAAVAHLRAGKHWKVCNGWVEL
jgi:hypothetical protein